MTTVAQTIVDQLNAWGVDSLYGVAGDTILPLLGALSTQDNVRFYPVKHESSAGFMASAHAKMDGNVGFCLVHAGPGLANALNGIADAANDQVPMVVLSGQVPQKEIGTHFKQYLDESRLMDPLAVYSAPVTSGESIVDIMTMAYHRAIADRGVAHISIPVDLLSKEINVSPHPPEPYLTTPTLSNEETIHGAIALLEKATKPLILLGRGGRSAGRLVQILAERWGAGIILSLGAKGAVSGRHPLVIGGLGQGGAEPASQLLKQADLLLTVGSTWWPKDYVPANLPIIQIDVEPEHIGLVSPVAYGIVGTAESVLAQLLSQWQPTWHEDWQNTVRLQTDTWWQQMEAEANLVNQPIMPQRLIGDLEQAISPEATISLDVGDHTVWFNRIFRGERQEILLSGNWRSMGFGLPAAIQAKLRHPERQVVALVGDGGFAMTQMELCTASRYRLPIMVVVVNNGCLAMEKNRMTVAGLPTFGVDLANPDFVSLARACGVNAQRVTDPLELLPVFRWGLAQNGPVLIDVDTAAPILPHTQFG